MKVVSPLAQMVCCCSGLLLAIGCGEPSRSRSTGQAQGEFEYICFSPAKIRVSPVTELIMPKSADGSAQIKVCVALLDPFESYLKAPGTFRFELYERVLRSAMPKGKRINMWSDMDLRSVHTNNEYWQEVWHAYEFDLEFDPQKDKSYILQVTFIPPGKKRLTADYAL